jgi:hypothetical protein
MVGPHVLPRSRLPHSRLDAATFLPRFPMTFPLHRASFRTWSVTRNLRFFRRRRANCRLTPPQTSTYYI